MRDPGGNRQLVRLNASLDRAVLSSDFATHSRIQIRNVLEPEAALAIGQMLTEQTRWGLSWQAGRDGPHRLRHEELASQTPSDGPAVSRKLHEAMQGNDFAFIYSQYRMSKELEAGTSRSPRHDALVRELNGADFLDFIREVTGLTEIRVCDAQATHFGPGQFLSIHQDINEAPGEDRLVAYVLGFCARGWRPDWGGYLNFYDDDGDIIEGFMPRFNCLNMFSVPQHHSVSFIPPYASGDRLAITGWFRSQ